MDYSLKSPVQEITVHSQRSYSNRECITLLIDLFSYISNFICIYCRTCSFYTLLFFLDIGIYVLICSTNKNLRILSPMIVKTIFVFLDNQSNDLQKFY